MALTPLEQNKPDSPFRLQLVNSIRLADQAETTLAVNLENQDLRAAYEVKVQLVDFPDSGYFLESWRSPNRLVGKLSSGEKQTLNFTVLTKNLQAPYVDVMIEVSYEQGWVEKHIRFKVRVSLTTEINKNILFPNPYITGE